MSDGILPTVVLGGVLVMGFVVQERLKKQQTDLSFCTDAFNNPELRAKAPNVDCDKVFSQYNADRAPI